MKKKYIPFTAWWMFVLPSHILCQSAEDYIKTGQQMLKSEDYKGASQAFEEAINRDSGTVENFLRVNEKYEKLSSFEAAEADTALPVARKEWAVPYYYRGVCLAKLGKKEEAARDYQKALKIDSDHADSYYRLGMLQYKEGKKDEGCIHLRRAMDLGHEEAKSNYETNFCWNNSMQHYRNGVTKLSLKEYNDAIQEFTMAIMLNPDSSSAYARRGIAYSGTGKHDLAIKDQSKAIGIDPKNGSYYINRGMSYAATGKYQLAFDDYTTALSINSRYRDAYVNRAEACEGLGNNSSALYDYSKALQIKPEAVLYFKSALLKQELNDKKGACDDFKKAYDMGYEEASEHAEQCSDKKRGRREIRN